ncbi:FKBP-type peptidyl-prolyl cis-trans isomerase [Thermosulfuriphilus sp.]
MDKPTVNRGVRVVISYRVWASGKVVDASSQPVTFICGQGKFMPYVEEALIGAKVGERRRITVPPEHHYGRYDPSKLIAVSRERLPGGVAPGEVVRLADEYWVIRPALVRQLADNYAVVDFNHPLAGKDLQFEVEILEVSYDEAPAPSEPVSGSS